MSRRRKRKETEDAEHWRNYMSTKISKLSNQFDGERRNNSGIFSGVSIFVNGYTEPTAEELKECMIQNGGTYHHYYSSGKTTHIIASNLANTKIKNFKNKLLVLPKWIVDSLSASKLLDYRDYVLYSNRTPNQPSIKGMCRTSEDSSKKNESGKSNGDKLKFPDDIIANEHSQQKDTESKNSVSTLNTKHLSSDSQKVTHGDKLSKDVGTVTASSSKNVPVSTKFQKNAVNTSNANFLTEFYANSRLHHISTMASLFKDYVEKCQTGGKELNGRRKFTLWLKYHEADNSSLDMEVEPVIMHVDMDCFFVSAGLRTRPELRGLPVVVTHSKGTGPKPQEGSDRAAEFQIYADRNASLTTNLPKNVDSSVSKKAASILSTKIYGIDQYSSMAEIACCSYEARRFGIKNGMLLGAALKLCPNLKTIPYDFDAYKEVAFVLYDFITSFTTRVEAVSCDEMYVNVTADINELGASPTLLAEFFRHEVLTGTGCSCSIGIGPNILLARLATKKAKPDGIYWIAQSKASDFICECPLAQLPGIGWSYRNKLEDSGAVTCGDLQNWDLARLQDLVGNKMGQSLFNYCRGIDHREVNCQNNRKSVSAEINYGIRFQNWTDAETFIGNLSAEVSERLKSCGMRGKSLTLKVKIRSANAPAEAAKFMGHGACDNATKSVSLPTAVWCPDIVKERTFALLKSICSNPKELRGIGIQLSKLEKEASNNNSLRNYFTNSLSEVPVNVTKSATSPVNRTERTMSPINRHKIISPVSRPKRAAPLVNRSKKAASPGKILSIDILHELPENLRLEVIQDYKANGYIIPDHFSDPQTSKNVGQSPAKEHLFNGRSNIIFAAVPEDSVSEDDISFSQINTSFIEALPDNLKVELKQQLKRKLPVVDKAQVPRKRGRPRGKMGKAVKSKANNPLNVVPVPSISNDPTISHRSFMSTPPQIRCSPSLPDLGGETEFSAIKGLLMRWIESCDWPQDEDLDDICCYCRNLVVGRDLETLDLFLKFFRRKLKGRAKGWEIALQKIIGKVQVSMKDVYNYPLKIS